MSCKQFRRRTVHQAAPEGMESDLAECALHWYPACREAFATASQNMEIHMQLKASRYWCIFLPSRRENDVRVISFHPVLYH